MDDTIIEKIKERIDLCALIERELGAPVQRSARWLKFFCPFHENIHTPALGVNKVTNTFFCFSCRKGGDVFRWLMLRQNISFDQALKILREQEFPLSLPVVRYYQPDDLSMPPAEKWQSRGRQFLEYVQNYLQSNSGEPGMQELKRRGLHPETIQHWGIGYNPEWRNESPERWGLENTPPDARLWLPPGLVIPCFSNEDSLSYIKVRVFGKNKKPVGKGEGKPKYIQLQGSKQGLFGSAHFLHKPVLLLVESELDAILAWQEGGNLLDVASLGGAGKALHPNLMLNLLSYQRIYMAYDADQAGKNGAEKLSALSARLVNWQLPAADVGAFFASGGDLRGEMEGMDKGKLYSIFNALQ